MELDNYLKDMDTRRKDNLQEDRENIIRLVKTLKVTNPTEISKQMLIPTERCQALVYELLKQNKIFKLVLNQDIVPIELVSRLHEFISKGIHGFEMFSKITWIIPESQIPYKWYKYDNEKGTFIIDKTYTGMAYFKEQVEEEYIN